MNNIPILFVRYAPGAAGNFLIALLQTSTCVACWNTVVESSKSTTKFTETFKNWFAQSFQENLDNHLKFEPHHPYQLDFFSSKHPRGNEITVDKFIEHLEQHNDQLFLDNIKKNKLTVMRLNKSEVPNFGQGNHIINIVVDQPAKKWLYRTRFIKLFGREQEGWISKENHPEFLKAKFKKNIFQNPYKFQVSKFTFLKDFVVGEAAIRPFFSYKKLLEPPSNLSCQHTRVDLSELIDRDKLLIKIQELFQTLELGVPDMELLSWCFDHYYQTNIQPNLL
jgi:hypothetical protein